MEGAAWGICSSSHTGRCAPSPARNAHTSRARRGRCRASRGKKALAALRRCLRLAGWCRSFARHTLTCRARELGPDEGGRGRGGQTRGGGVGRRQPWGAECGSMTYVRASDHAYMYVHVTLCAASWPAGALPRYHHASAQRERCRLPGIQTHAMRSLSCSGFDLAAIRRQQEPPSS